MPGTPPRWAPSSRSLAWRTGRRTQPGWCRPPYWVDIRLVGIGRESRTATSPYLARSALQDAASPRAKALYCQGQPDRPRADDQESGRLLRRIYPQGSLGLHRSPSPGRDFWVYCPRFLPPTCSWSDALAFEICDDTRQNTSGSMTCARAGADRRNLSARRRHGLGRKSASASR